MKLKLLVLSMGLFVSQLALAGNEGGGGGDAVILPNGNVVLADIFLDRNQPQPNNMPRRISLNPKLLLQLKIYGQFFQDRTRPLGIGKEIAAQIADASTRESNLVFYSVKDTRELNTYCASGGRKAYILPSGAEVSQVACTAGNEVFIVEPIFRKMSLHYQTLLIIHERLTTLRDEFGGKNYGAIAGVTSGLGQLVEIAYEQQNGKLRLLTDVEVTKTRHFYEAVIEIEYRSKDIPTNSLDWSIHPFGGGLVWNGSKIAEDAFIASTSSVGGGSEIEAGAILVNTDLSSGAFVGLGTKIKNVKLNMVDLKVEKESVITNSIFSMSAVSIGMNSRLDHVTTQTTNLNIGHEAIITNSKINQAKLKIGRAFKMINSEISIGRSDSFCRYYPNGVCPFETELSIKDSQSMLNGIMKNNFQDYLPDPYVSTFTEIKIGKTLTDCQEPMKVYKREKPNTVKDRDCLFYEFVNSDSEFSFVYQKSFGSSSVIVNQDIDTDKSGGFLGRKNLLAVIRSFDVTVNFTNPGKELSQNETEYTLYDGVLSIARRLRVKGDVSIRGKAGDLIQNQIIKYVEQRDGYVEKKSGWPSYLTIWSGVTTK